MYKYMFLLLAVNKAGSILVTGFDFRFGSVELFNNSIGPQELFNRSNYTPDGEFDIFQRVYVA